MLFLHFEWLARKSFRARARAAWWDRNSWRRLRDETAELSDISAPGTIAPTRRGAVGSLAASQNGA